MLLPLFLFFWLYQFLKIYKLWNSLFHVYDQIGYVTYKMCV